MSAGGMSTGHGGRGSANQDFELNLASIIDCFTVLIAFMLATASFLSIGILDAGVAAAGAQASTSTEPPPVTVTVELKKDRTILVELTGKEQRKETVPQGKDGYDTEALAAQLQAIKSRWPATQAATLQAENDIEYREVIRVMETTRKTLPAVLLGGF